MMEVCLKMVNGCFHGWHMIWLLFQRKKSQLSLYNRDIDDYMLLIYYGVGFDDRLASLYIVHMTNNQVYEDCRKINILSM